MISRYPRVQTDSVTRRTFSTLAWLLCFLMHLNVLSGFTTKTERPTTSVGINSSGWRKPVTEHIKPHKQQELFESPINEGWLEISRKSDPIKATAGSIFIIWIIIGLAMSQQSSEEVASQVVENGVWDGTALRTVGTVMDAAAPSSATDLVAGTIGESIGGVIGALVTATLGFILPRKRRSKDEPIGTTKPIAAKVIADSDYFVAASTSYPLLQAAGLEGDLAYIASILFGTLRSQVTKITFQQKAQVKEENRLLQELLEEEEKSRKLDSSALPVFWPRTKRQEGNFDVQGLKPVVPEYKIDFVEVFSDTLRWLEYGVLNTDFADTLTWNSYPLAPAIRGAGLGVLAAVSSQLYADALYTFFRLGPESKQQEVDSRTVLDWASIYVSTSFSAAALFGIYEGAERPISRWIQGTLAGGVDGCFGSDAFDQCMQTYIDTNAPGPSTAAQFRALVTNLVMVGQRLQDVAGDTSADDVKSLIAAWAVEADSYLHHLCLPDQQF